MSDNNNPPGSAVKPAPIRSTSEIAEQVLNGVTWIGDDRGYCQCPGHTRHTQPDGNRDCIVYLNGAPTLHCLHASCESVVARKNAELREAIRTGQSNGAPEPSSREIKRLTEARQRCERVRTRASKSRPVMLKRWRWPYADIVASSPTLVPEARLEQTRLLLGAYKPGDVVWIGERSNSGQPHHTACFKTIEEWMAVEAIDGPLICPATFKPDGHSRSNDNVQDRRFLVVESDTMGKDEVGAVFRWLRDEVGLELIAIVDTAGKSLHAWFGWPGDDELDDMKLVLPALGCDPRLFTKSQPVRLAGGLRDGRVQRMIYFKGGAR